MVIFEKLLEYFSFLRPMLANLGSISIGPGWLFAAFGAVVLSLYGLSVGKTRAVMSLLSVYVAFAFDRLFPFFDSLEGLVNSSMEAYFLRIGLFLGIYILVFIIFSLSFMRKRISAAEFSLASIVLVSFLQLGFLISILFSMIPPPLAESWSFGFYYLFNINALFFWAMAPIPALLILRK